MLKYIPERPVNENKLQEWLNGNLNVMLVGSFGIGKSERILSLFQKNFGNKWAYFNGPTTDPWTDLIGIPTAEVVNGEKVIKYVKPEELSGDIEGIYLDEINRARANTRNSLFELIQFKSINGRKFSNLKVVWSSINPPKEEGEDNDENFNYDVEELDPAMLDRFHIIVKLPFEPELSFFRKKYDTIGVNLVEWWNQQPKEAKALISPRRLEYVAQMYLKKMDITDALPKCSNTKMLLKKINCSPTINKYNDLMEKTEKSKSASVIKELYELVNKENSFEEIKNVLTKNNQWEILDLIVNEEKIDLLYNDYEKEIEDYFYKNGSQSGRLFNFLSKKIGDSDKFKQHIKNVDDLIEMNPQKYLKTVNLTIEDSSSNEPKNIMKSMKDFLDDNGNIETYYRRSYCAEILSGLSKTKFLPKDLKIFTNFLNLLVKKTQLNNRTNIQHTDGKYIYIFSNLIVDICEQKNIEYKNESFYSDLTGLNNKYFDEKLLVNDVSL